MRVDGIDTETGRARPKQIGTYPSQRAARAAATKAISDGDGPVVRGNLAWLLDRWVASRTDISAKSKLQYEWGAGHVKAGLGQLPLDKLDRDDVARWFEAMAAAGKLSKRSLQICRMVLRAALADAVDEGLIRRSPAARVALRKVVVKLPTAREADAWEEAQVRRSSPPSRTTYGAGRCGWMCSMGCGAASCWRCDGRESTSMPGRSRSLAGWSRCGARRSERRARTSGRGA